MRKLLTLTRSMRWSERQKAPRSLTRIVLASVLGVALAGALGTGLAQARPTAASCSGPSVTAQPFGTAFDLYAGKQLPVFRYTLTNCKKMTVQILSYGAITQSITVPDKSGNLADVVLGFKTLDNYVAQASPPPPATGGPYFGEIVGRYGNRIKDTFQLNGHTYTLPINNGVNSLHGGFVGFGNHVWASKAVHQNGMAGVALTLVSPNGDDGANVALAGRPDCTGYPGTLTLTVTYLLDNSSRLWIHYHATVAGQPTVLNPTNHSYFNLAGESLRGAYGQEVMINADTYTPTDTTQIPTGVDGARSRARRSTSARPTPFRIADQRERPDQLLIAQGYDHNWVLNSTGRAPVPTASTSPRRRWTR